MAENTKDPKRLEHTGDDGHDNDHLPLTDAPRKPFAHVQGQVPMPCLKVLSEHAGKDGDVHHACIPGND